MIDINKALRLTFSTMLFVMPITLPASANHQDNDQEQVAAPKFPSLTQRVRCTVDHVIGCSQEKPYCADGDAILADVSGGSPTFYELDLLNRTARLKGKDEKGVVVQIQRVGFIPDLGIANVQGINEGWMPWTLSYRLSDGKGFVSEVTPGFTSLSLVNCVVIETP